MKNKKTKMVNQKGFAFTIEATIALLCFALMICFLPHTESFSLKEIAIIQQENDLLRVWSASETNEAEMINDLHLMLGENASLYINEKQIAAGKSTKNILSSEGIIIDSTLADKKIRVEASYD